MGTHTRNGGVGWWHLIGEELPDGNPYGIGQPSKAVNGWIIRNSPREGDAIHPHGIGGPLDGVAVRLKRFFYFHCSQVIIIHGQR